MNISPTQSENTLAAVYGSSTPVTALPSLNGLGENQYAVRLKDIPVQDREADAYRDITVVDDEGDTITATFDRIDAIHGTAVYAEIPAHFTE